MSSVVCDRCGNDARVVKHVQDLDQLAQVARKLQMQQAMPPFYVLHCEKCGERVQVSEPGK